MMNKRNKARIGLVFALIATVLTTVLLTMPHMAIIPLTVLTIAAWIATAVFVLPIYMQKKEAQPDEYKCPKMSFEEICGKIKRAMGSKCLSVTDEANNCLFIRNDEANKIHAVYAVQKAVCTDEWIRGIDAIFWDLMKSNVENISSKNITASILLVTENSNEALMRYLVEGGAEAHCTQERTRIRIAATYVTSTGLLSVAVPEDGEKALFGKEGSKMSTFLSHAVRENGI